MWSQLLASLMSNNVQMHWKINDAVLQFQSNIGANCYRKAEV